MKVEPLPPIPSPPAHHWRQFRVKAMPVVAFVAILGLALWLWSENLENPAVMATAQGLEADIISPRDGLLVELRVRPFEDVHKGEVLAVIHPASPEITSNTVAMLKAEMELIRSENGFDGGDQVRYAQFQLDWMLERADLVALQSQLAYAEREHTRISSLVERKILEPSALDVAQRDLDQARELVNMKSTAVEQAEQLLRQLNPAADGAPSPATTAALNLANERIRLAEAELHPIEITAPIDGRISKIARLEGVAVTKGESIVTVASQQVEYILGYVGQPLRVEPTLGMNVEVRSRGLNRNMGMAKITDIGPRIELFNAPLRIRGMGNAQQRGLPIIVSVPPEMALRPGELVDLTLGLN